MKKIRHQVHRLPTDKAATYEEDGKLHHHPTSMHIPKGNAKPFYIYFTNDEEIKEGDYCIYDNGLNSPGFIVIAIATTTRIVYRKPNETWGDYGREDGGITPLPSGVRKITGSTNPKLTNCNICGINLTETGGKHKMSCKDAYKRTNLPQISQDFIKAYCEQGGIDEVDVEYEKYIVESETSKTDGVVTQFDFTDYRPKLNSDNTIITHLIEEKMYSRGEMEVLMKNFIQFYTNRDSDKKLSGVGVWIKENL